MANVEIGQTSGIAGFGLKKLDVVNWPRLREENRHDFERTLKPLFDDLERWRSLSARGKPWSPFPRKEPAIKR